MNFFARFLVVQRSLYLWNYDGYNRAGIINRNDIVLFLYSDIDEDNWIRFHVLTEFGLGFIRYDSSHRLPNGRVGVDTFFEKI